VHNMKICSTCKTEKESSEFFKAKNTKDKLYSQCKKCKNEYKKKHYIEHREQKKEYQTKNKYKIQQYREKNKDKIREQKKIYGKRYYIEHREEIKKRRDMRREEINKYTRKHCVQRRKNDIDYKIKCNLRCRIGQVIRNNNKSASTQKLLGCTVEFLKRHLEAKFTDGMNWNNYGTGFHNKKEWHIDHIKPCASFNLTKDIEQQKCFHFSNLQPLWSKDNLKKGAK